MTTPEQPQNPETDEVLGVLALMMAGAGVATTAAAIAGFTGIPPAALRAALLIQGWREESLPTRPGGILENDAQPGTAENITQHLNHMRQAAYTVKSGRRLQDSLRQGYSADEAAGREMRYFSSHWSAINRRTNAAREIDQLARWHGDLLGWYAELDDRTSPECRRANGGNFKVSQPPAIGYPGAVHPHCRCKPGVSHATRRMV